MEVGGCIVFVKLNAKQAKITTDDITGISVKAYSGGFRSLGDELFMGIFLHAKVVILLIRVSSKPNYQNRLKRYARTAL